MYHQILRAGIKRNIWLSVKKNQQFELRTEEVLGGTQDFVGGSRYRAAKGGPLKWGSGNILPQKVLKIEVNLRNGISGILK